MDLSLTDEQQLLKDSVARFVQDNYGADVKRAARDTELGFSLENWQQFAELGWLALPFTEADGGLDGSALDVAILAEEFGRGLVSEPYLVNIVVCGGLLAAADVAQRAAVLPALIAGESQWAFAFAEPTGRYNLANISLTATAEGDDFLLNGTKIAVLNGHAAENIIVTVRTAGSQCDSGGISLFVVPADAAGVSREAYPLVDGTRGADLRLSNVRVGADALVGELNNGLSLVEDVVAQAGIAMGAEAVGAMDAVLEQTIEYCKTREQFDQPISNFQALQHRMADMYMHCQNLRSLLYYAAIARDEDREDKLQAAAAVQFKLGEAGRYVSQQAVQLHGGMGMTDELAVGHYFKRLLLLNTLFGDSEHNLDRYISL